MEKTEALDLIEWKAALNLPCSVAEWRDAVLENPNYMQDDYDHLIKYSAIPEEVLSQYFNELHEALKPLEEACWNMAPSKGILYMVQNPEYAQEWNDNWKKRQELQESQKEERLCIQKRLHRKYLTEYGIKFNSHTYL